MGRQGSTSPALPRSSSIATTSAVRIEDALDADGRNQPPSYALLAGDARRSATRSDFLAATTTAKVRRASDQGSHVFRSALTTRERSFLLSKLNAQLYASSPSPNAVWDGLLAVLSYPNELPNVSRAHDEADDDSTSRTAINLSEAQLRRAFSILSTSRPRTRSGLARLLVVVELMAKRRGKSINLDPSRMSDQSDQPIEIDPRGIGLRRQEWARLVEWLALSYRAPRRSHELKAAVDQFSHMLADEMTSEDDNDRSEVYRSMLRAAVENKSSEVFKAVEQRREQEGIRDSSTSEVLRFVRAHRMGESTRVMWPAFVRLLRRADELHIDQRVIWNNMLWHLARQRDGESAKRLFDALKTATEVDFAELTPEECDSLESSIMPPGPDAVTFAIMVKGFVHADDPTSALLALADSFKAPQSQIAPLVQNFGSIFKGFAMFGSIHNVEDIQAALTTAPAELSSRQLIVAAAHVTSAWSLESLSLVIQALERLEAPSIDERQRVKAPHEGQRTSPTPRDLHWLILALEKTTDNDHAAIVHVWDRLRDKFTKDKGGWTGLRADTRLSTRIAHHVQQLQSQSSP